MGNAPSEQLCSDECSDDGQSSYVYGPVPSRRLGQSLGVDPIPLKTCNFNCVYCQLGRTSPVTNDRMDFFPPDEIVAQVRSALERLAPGEVDFVTFVGQGEPTLCASLGWMIRRVKEITGIPVAVITNGALLYQAEVQGELAVADVVMPSLDAVDDPTFRRINRPWPYFSVRGVIDGLVNFRKMLGGRLWIEVMLVKGLNDEKESLVRMSDCLHRIQADRVQINVPVRPPAEPWVEIPDDETIAQAVAILGEAAEVVGPYDGAFDLSGCNSLAEAVLGVIRRHPMRESRLTETLAHYAPEEVTATLASLEHGGKACRSVYRGEVFWQYVSGGQALHTHSSVR